MSYMFLFSCVIQNSLRRLHWFSSIVFSGSANSSRTQLSLFKSFVLYLTKKLSTSTANDISLKNTTL